MHKTHADLIKELQTDPAPIQAMRSALRIIGDKWSGLIFVCLFERPCRFSDFEAMLPGISPRTLTHRLRKLEALGLITRHEYKEFPPRIEYRLTERALALKPVLRELKTWAKNFC